MTGEMHGPWRSEIAYVVRELEREHDLTYSERARETGRRLAHLRD